MAIVETTRSITGGVDTHLDTHVVAALDPNGGVLGVARSRRPARATARCRTGWANSERSAGSVSRAPVPMAPELLAICAASVWR